MTCTWRPVQGVRRPVQRGRYFPARFSPPVIRGVAEVDLPG